MAKALIYNAKTGETTIEQAPDVEMPEVQYTPTMGERIATQRDISDQLSLGLMSLYEMMMEYDPDYFGA